MSAVIIGSPASGQKVLRRSDFATQRNGLENLIETYTIRTVDRVTLQPDFNDLHKDITTASTKFTRMAVENIAFKEQDGDLTEMTITYVGLLSASGLPPALVKIIPQMDKGIFGPPCVINVEFISDKTVSQINSGLPGADLPTLTPIRTTIPAQINGTAMPPNPVQPFSSGTGSRQTNANFAGGQTFTQYHGYCLTSIQAEQRGLFVIVVHEYAEQLTSVSTS